MPPLKNMATMNLQFGTISNLQSMTEFNEILHIQRKPSGCSACKSDFSSAVHNLNIVSKYPANCLEDFGVTL